MNFQENYFEIFQFPVAFDVDRAQLAERYHELQKRIHPDRFAGASEKERRLSMQWATRVNEAYTTLDSPLKRAIYLLSLEGVDMQGKENASVDPGFLMEQMELREELEGIESHDDPLESLDEFKARVRVVVAELEHEFEERYPSQLPDAEQTVLKMQFMHKLSVAAEQLEEKLLDY